MKRRELLLASATALAGFETTAQAYPAHPVRIVVPFPAGGTTDIITRALAQRLSGEWRQPVIVDNRPGAGANIGAEHVARAAPDGHTLLMASTAHSINATLYPRLNYDPVKDFSPITLVAETAQVLVVHPSVKADNVKEFLQYLRSQPSPVSYSSAGNGSQPHLSTELFKSMSGIQMLHVPYKGGPQAMTDLMAGHVLASFATAPSAVPNVRTGKIKAIGVSSRRRIPALPDVPTIAESGLPGYEASGFFGLVGPSGMSPSVVAQVHATVARLVKDPGMSKYLVEQGADPVLSATPAEYGTFIREEVTKWGRVVQETGARID
jgi:tripartite-type tricarboxylate transporter receptor subunit TctC